MEFLATRHSMFFYLAFVWFSIARAYSPSGLSREFWRICMFEGQWGGEVQEFCFCLVNVDQERDHINIRMNIMLEPENIVFSFYFANTAKHEKVIATSDVEIFEYETTKIVSREAWHSRFGDKGFPIMAQLNVSIASENGLDIVAKLFADNNVNDNPIWECKGIISRNKIDQVSSIGAEVDAKSWREFRDLILSEKVGSNFVFRGQSRPFPLRTSFHRTNRKDLYKYMNIDIIQAYKAYVGRQGKDFNLSDPDDVGSFLYLLQHHGFPTPLLDWTRSPFVAAYFAYQEAAVLGSESVRIFMFDHENWNFDWRESVSLNILNVGPHLTFFEPVPLRNARAVSQQAVCSISNVDNIEALVLRRENKKSKKYLYAFDLPAAEREYVLKDLRYMGLTPATIMPGLDGICADIRSRNFM